jgi:adenylate cyclase
LAIEVERKFLVANDDWKSKVDQSTHFRQGYIHPGPPASVRVRIEGDQANLNIKQSVLNIERMEFEYPIPMEDAEQLLDSACQSAIIQKTRHLVKVDNHVWEIDVFEADNVGLIVAEIELNSVEESFTLPDWIGEEVSNDPRYLNSSLSRTPFCQW